MIELETLSAYDWTLWIAGLFALLELCRWIYSMKEFVFEKLGIKTKGMLKREEYANRLKQVENSIEEIKNTYKKNVETSIEHERQVVDKVTGIKGDIVTELNKIREEMEKAKKANDKTDCAMLRDRINSGMRYFNKNICADGKVHIAFTDYVNMDALFQEYFTKHGNGPFEKMYEEEFKHFVIDM